MPLDMPGSAQSTPPSDSLGQALEAALGEVAWAVGARIMESWADGARRSLSEARLLLVLGLAKKPSTGAELAALCGISINDVFSVLQELISRGEVKEDSRSYELTEDGDASVQSLAAARRAGISDYVAALDADSRERVAASLGVERA
jgi:DNA-binding MarR family transcriptional regulator